MKKRDQGPRLVSKTQMHLRWSLLAVSGHRRSCSEVAEGELKGEEFHQMKTDPSPAQVLGNSEHSRERRGMFRGWKHAPRAASKMVASEMERLVRPISSE